MYAHISAPVGVDECEPHQFTTSIHDDIVSVALLVSIVEPVAIDRLPHEFTGSSPRAIVEEGVRAKYGIVVH
jgi:hypothetical protein